MTAALPARRGVLLAAAALAALALGAAFAVRPTLGAAALGALFYVPAAMIAVPLGVAGWISAEFVKTIPGLATTSMLIVVGVAWLGSLVARRPTRGELLPGQRFLIGVLAMLLAWLTISLLWSTNSEEAWHELRWWFVSAGILVVVATVTRTPAHLRLIMGAFVLGGVASVLGGWLGVGPRELIIVGSLASKSPLRFTGAEGDPNQLAAELLPAIVFAAALAADRRRPIERGVLLAATAVLIAGLAASESRGGLVAAGAVLLLAPLLYSERRRRSIALVLVVLAACGAWLAASPAVRHRVANISNGGDGRSTLWLVALRIAEQHPLAGVGINNFRVVAPNYVFRPGPLRFVEQVTDQPHVVHNTYLELLAETGIVGLALFLAAVAACLSAARRAARIFERLGQTDMVALSRAVMLAGVGALVAQVFISDGYDWRYWAVFALGPALLGLATAALARTKPLPRC